MEILKVKENGQNRYLLNDTMSVPKSEDNRHYRMIQEWIADGGVVEPQYTPQELEAQKQYEENVNALQYLEETDWYVIRASEDGTEIPKDVLDKRKKARRSVKK